MKTKYVVALHVTHTLAGEIYSNLVLSEARFAEYYAATSCGSLRKTFKSRKSANTAAQRWLDEMNDGPYAAR